MRPDPAQGVFETLLARGGRIQALHRHLDRLASSVGGLYGERLPGDLQDRLRGMASEVTSPHRIRVDFIPGQPLMIQAQPVRGAAEETHRLRPRNIAGGLGPHKWRDRRLLDSDGTYVPLIVDGDDVLEAAWANVWILEGERAITPPTDGRILPGVTRGLLLELEPAAIEQPISVRRAQDADAIILTSSVRLAVPATLGEEAHSPKVLAMISRWISLVPP